ncbi:MAG: 9-O-acetylesterase, partial [Verrucomicrobiae bacterium]
MKKMIVSFAVMSLAPGSLCAEDMAQEFTVQSVFSSHMVLQRERPISISGTATPGKAVHVEFAGQKVAAVADSSGKWAAVFPAMAAGGPYTLMVTGGKGSNPVKFEDVLVGEVWVCSGQSNMEWPLDKSLNAG